MSTGPSDARHAKWEYAELSSFADANTRPRSFSVSWEDATQTFNGKSWSELAEELGYLGIQNNSTALLNALGAEGWELVNHSIARGLTEIHTGSGFCNFTETFLVWTLKRAK